MPTLPDPPPELTVATLPEQDKLGYGGLSVPIGNVCLVLDVGADVQSVILHRQTEEILIFLKIGCSSDDLGVQGLPC